MNGVFFEVFTEFMLKSGEADSSHELLMDFARCYGMCQQLVNDTCDYLPLPVSNKLTTISKLPEDTFSDMRRRLLTLPMISYFSKLSDEEECVIRNHYQTPGTPLNYLNESAGQKKVLMRLLNKKAINHAKSLVCVFRKHIHSELDLDSDNPATELMLNMFCFVDENRFYKAYDAYK